MTHWGLIKEWFSFKGSVVKFRRTEYRGAYGKHGNPDPDPEPEPESGTGTGTGTGTGEINEWFKLGSMIDINTPPLLSAFLARWMTIRWDYVWDGALIIQNIFDNTGQLLEMWVVRVKIWVCYGCYYTEQRSNEQQTRDRLTGKKSRGQKFSNLLKICRIDYNRFFSIDI